MTDEHWMEVLAPGATPPALVGRLRDEIAAVLRDPAMVERMRSMGVEPVANTPEEFRTYLAADRDKFARIFRQAGLTAE